VRKHYKFNLAMVAIQPSLPFYSPDCGTFGSGQSSAPAATRTLSEFGGSIRHRRVVPLRFTL